MGLDNYTIITCGKAARCAGYSSSKQIIFIVCVPWAPSDGNCFGKHKWINSCEQRTVSTPDNWAYTLTSLVSIFGCSTRFKKKCCLRQKEIFVEYLFSSVQQTPDGKRSFFATHGRTRSIRWKLQRQQGGCLTWAVTLYLLIVRSNCLSSNYLCDLLSSLPLLPLNLLTPLHPLLATSLSLSLDRGLDVKKA